MDEPRLFLVDERALPPALIKVTEARYLLDSGQIKSASKAAAAAGISRSVYYKYKDYVSVYSKSSGDRVVTLNAILSDTAGVLSEFIGVLTGAGANILTINQSIPVNNVAAVSVSIRTERLLVSLEQLIQELKKVQGMMSLYQITGGI